VRRFQASNGGNRQDVGVWTRSGCSQLWDGTVQNGYRGTALGPREFINAS